VVITKPWNPFHSSKYFWFNILIVFLWIFVSLHAWRRATASIVRCFRRGEATAAFVRVERYAGKTSAERFPTWRGHGRRRALPSSKRQAWRIMECRWRKSLDRLSLDTKSANELLAGLFGDALAVALASARARRLRKHYQGEFTVPITMVSPAPFTDPAPLVATANAWRFLLRGCDGQSADGV
jgi:hypothetical protein